ncbi:MAG TPA: fimbria/pilus periplasmic chaperone [Terriglobales bacterium]|nr:fimbria/pilus periplasmic chaperone [Terriglobales bacterium]
MQKLFFLILLLGSVPGALRASSITLAPVRLELSASRPYAVLRMTNNGSEPVTLQARPYRWSFDARGDVLTATDNVILNPPIATLPPKGVQLVRIGLRVPNEDANEATYRLIIDEVPVKKAGAKGMSLTMVLRMSVPVFALPRRPVSPRLEWSAHRDAAGVLKIAAVNRGAAHVLIKSFHVSRGADNQEAETFKDLAYLLPNQQREWTLKKANLAAATELTLEAVTDGGNVRQTLTPASN